MLLKLNQPRHLEVIKMLSCKNINKSYSDGNNNGPSYSEIAYSVEAGPGSVTVSYGEYEDNGDNTLVGYDWNVGEFTLGFYYFDYEDDASVAGGSGIEWYYNGSNVQKLYVNNTEYEFPDGTQAPAYKWVHYAICREGTNTRIFVDGELMTTYASHSATITGDIITGCLLYTSPSPRD